MDDNIKGLLKEAGVDLERTMERFINNEAFYLKFLKRFPDDPNYASLKKAVEEKDLNEVERAAHTLKGVSANLGLDPVADALNEIVRAVRGGECGDLDTLYKNAEKQYEVFTGIIEQIPAQ